MDKKIKCPKCGNDKKIKRGFVLKNKDICVKIVDVVIRKVQNMVTLKEKNEKQFDIITRESNPEELKGFSG
jgi:hypothetical protein